MDSQPNIFLILCIPTLDLLVSYKSYMSVEFAFPPALLDLRENINYVTDLKLQFVFIGWLIAEEHLAPAPRHCTHRFIFSLIILWYN